MPNVGAPGTPMPRVAGRKKTPAAKRSAQPLDSVKIKIEKEIELSTEDRPYLKNAAAEIIVEDLVGEGCTIVRFIRYSDEDIRAVIEFEVRVEDLELE